ncbi:MAG: hypothetical protein IPI74_04695 [Bacteroidales bacterium]|nr:hypothetical protein [Bacteroidales bacterium]
MERVRLYPLSHTEESKTVPSDSQTCSRTDVITYRGDQEQTIRFIAVINPEPEADKAKGTDAAQGEQEQAIRVIAVITRRGEPGKSIRSIDVLKHRRNYTQ